MLNISYYKYKQQLSQMQPSHKQQILKLLNFDNIINDYLKQPKLNRKTPACNYKPGTRRNLQYTNNDRTLHKTLEINKQSKWRNNSVHCMPHNTLDYCQSTNNKQSQIAKSQSSHMKRNFSAPNSQHGKLRHPIKSKQCIGSRIFKNTSMFDNQLPSSLALSTLRNPQMPNKKIKECDQSTKLIDNQQQHKQTEQREDNQEEKTQTETKNKNLSKNKQYKIGSILKGRYKLQKLIGRGLSGVVYKAKDVLADRYVAIKVIDIKNIEYQFIKEVQHPNIISYYNSFTQNNKRFLVLEYLPYSLSEVIKKKKLNLQQLKRVFKGILSGLLYLHSLSYAHRDIKLQNIVTNDNLTLVKFIDFGLCLDTNSNDTKQSKRFCGTLSYMAPQIVLGTCKQPKKTDIWSLGVVLYMLSIGRNPFNGLKQQEIFNKIVNKKIILPSDTPEKLKAFIMLMLQRNPEQRLTVFQLINHSWLSQ